VAVQRSLRERKQAKIKRVVTPPTRPHSASASAPTGTRDRWLQEAASRDPWTWAERRHQFRAFLPPAQSKALCKTLEQWGASADELEPLFRLVRAIVLSNLAHRGQIKGAKWAAGTARDPHHKLTLEEPGALRPLLDLVKLVISDLDRLTQWTFSPAIVVHEHDAKYKPTRRRVRLSRLDETIRAAFEKARTELLWVGEKLRQDTQRPRGRPATRVQPYRVSAGSRSAERPRPARLRDLAQLVRAEILALHPKRTTRPRAARAQAERLARAIIAAIPILN
jgi:hypothetical protein